MRQGSRRKGVDTIVFPHFLCYAITIVAKYEMNNNSIYIIIIASVPFFPFWGEAVFIGKFVSIFIIFNIVCGVC